MSKLIIDTQTGTILNIEHCYVIEAEELSDDDFTCDELQVVADRAGISISTMGKDTGWGDNSYRYTVSYSPKSIHDEADSLLEGGMYEEKDKEYSALVWAQTEATTEQLQTISDWAMARDSVWDGFRDNLTDALMFVYGETKETK
jgi:hypothetical protein